MCIRDRILRILYLIIHFIKAIIKVCFTLDVVLIIRVKGINPVSYTHLDVYKRQVQHGEITCRFRHLLQHGCAGIIGNLAAAVVVCIRKIARRGYGVRRRDVYKRQMRRGV